MDILPQKRCTKCGETKPLTGFHKRKSSPDGRRGVCAVCKTRAQYYTDPPRLCPGDMRLCATCKETKPVEVFRTSKTNRSGYESSCLECSRANARAWKARNKDRIRTYEEENRVYLRGLRKDWQKRNPERHKANRKRQYEGNKEYYRRKHDLWYAVNREKAIARSMAYHRTEAGKIRRRLAASKYRALRKEGDATLEEINALMKRQTHCAYCKKKFTKKLPATIDHVVPLSRGGLHTISNLVLACKPCNSRKYNNPIYLI